MKTILLSFLFFITSQISAQYTSVFGDNSTIWQGIKYNMAIFNDSTVTNNETVVIESLTYKKLSQFFESAVEGSTTTPIESYIREEISTGKLWWKRNINIDEVLVMDMTLEVGDTFSVSPSTWNGGNTLLTVESVFYENDLKHIVFDYTLFGDVKFTFIEGLGTNIGITYNRYGSSDSNLFLLCSYKDGNLYFVNDNHDSLANQCKYEFSASISDNYLINNIKISPNYVTESFEVISEIAITKVEIYNLLGKRIKTFNKQDSYSILGASSGIYLVKIHTKNHGNLTKKILIK